VELNLDESRVASHRLVHRVVDDFCKKVVQRLLVCTANVHAWTAAYGLKALENLNVGCIVALLTTAWCGSNSWRRRAARCRSRFCRLCCWLLRRGDAGEKVLIVHENLTWVSCESRTIL